MMEKNLSMEVFFLYIYIFNMFRYYIYTIQDLMIHGQLN